MTPETAAPLAERDLPTLVVADASAADPASAAVLALPVGSGSEGQPGPQPGPGTAEALASRGLDLGTVAADARFTGSAGALLAFPVAPVGEGGPRRVVLVGTGDGSVRSLRRAGAALGRSLAGVERAAVGLADGLDAEHVRALVEGLLLGAWQAPRTGTSTPPGPVGTLVLHGLAGVPDVAHAVQQAVSTCRATLAGPRPRHHAVVGEEPDVGGRHRGRAGPRRARGGGRGARRRRAGRGRVRRAARRRRRVGHPAGAGPRRLDPSARAPGRAPLARGAGGQGDHLRQRRHQRSSRARAW